MVRLDVLLMTVIVLGVASTMAASVSLLGGSVGSTSTPNRPTASLIISTTNSITARSTTSTTTATNTSASSTSINGTLLANITIGPTQPVCQYPPSQSTPPLYYSSIKILITNSSGRTTTFSVNWVSDGCNVSGSLTTSLKPATYTLNLSSCTFLGCKAALPKDFVIYSGMTTDVDASIFTGIV